MPDNICAMTPIVASNQYLRNRPDGVTTSITVSIGTPAPITPEMHWHDPEQTFYCPVQFEGLYTEPLVLASGGASSLEAVCMSSVVISTILGQLPYKAEMQEYDAETRVALWRMPVMPIRGLHSSPGYPIQWLMTDDGRLIDPLDYHRPPGHDRK